MLTDTKCRNAKPSGKSTKLTDEKGLYLEVRPNGVKAWRYRFRLTKEGRLKESVFAIGEYASAPTGESPESAQSRRAAGQFTLSEARGERLKARALVKQGINPAHHRQLERIKKRHESATMFSAVAQEWVAAKEWEQESKAARLGMLERAVFPKIGRLPVRQITSAHILDVLKSAATNHGLTVAAEAKRSISGIFGLAVSTLRADSDPGWLESTPFLMRGQYSAALPTCQSYVGSPA
jgi:hypothetical protein